MIIDCHGHYTTFPKEVADYRENQKKALRADPLYVGSKGSINLSDDQLRESVENNQLKLQKERGTDLTIFSPRASWMGHHLGNKFTSQFWTEHQNDLIHRICQLYPKNFVPVAQLPQSPNLEPKDLIPELKRCVEMGFIGCNLNPDTTGGHWKDVPLSDKSWYPFYEKMVEYEVPAMIHVSEACNACFSTTGSYYLSADTTAFDQFMYSDVFKDFPDIKFIIPHGGGAVPYHWGRFRGIAQDKGFGDLKQKVLQNIYFDTCVYHQPGIDLLLQVIPVDNILFASEMIGAVRGIDPETGHYYDDTKRYIDNNSRLTEKEKALIFSGNSLKVFKRLNNWMAN
jgi:4-oxalmesaconate hydratase